MNWKTQEEETPPVGKWLAIIVSGAISTGCPKISPNGQRFWSTGRGRLADAAVLAWLELPKWTGVVRHEKPLEGMTKRYSTPSMRRARFVSNIL